MFVPTYMIIFCSVQTWFIDMIWKLHVQEDDVIRFHKNVSFKFDEQHFCKLFKPVSVGQTCQTYPYSYLSCRVINMVTFFTTPLTIIAFNYISLPTTFIFYLNIFFSTFSFHECFIFLFEMSIWQHNQQ